jgi:hypothetical protein
MVNKEALAYWRLLRQKQIEKQTNVINAYGKVAHLHVIFTSVPIGRG